MFNSKNDTSHHFGKAGWSILSAACVSACLSASPGWSAPLQSWRFDPTTNQLEVLISAGVKPRYFLLAQPARIVLDLPETEVGAVPTVQAYNGAVQEVRISQYQPGTARIVLVLAPDVVLANEQAKLQQVPDSDRLSDRWVLRPLFASVPSQPTAAKPASPSSLPPELQNALPPAPPSSTQVIVPPPTAGGLPSVMSATYGENRALSQGNPNGIGINSRDLPPASVSGSFNTPTVTVPPLERSTTPQNSVIGLPSSAIAPPSQPSRPSTIDFGQPLPGQMVSRAISTAGAVSLSNSVILPIGTNLLLQYPGAEPLRLQGNQSRPETLRLQSEIRDRTGRLIAPFGTPVFGRFETNRDGSRFIAEAIAVQGQNVSLIGRSDRIGNGSRQVSEGRLLRNSGIGALAGAILGGLSGGNVIGGAALGAGATYVLAPKPATIQPGQVISVQLMEDFR